jgi:hypothetical protein
VKAYPNIINIHLVIFKQRIKRKNIKERNLIRIKKAREKGGIVNTSKKMRFKAFELSKPINFVASPSTKFFEPYTIQPR